MGFSPRESLDPDCSIALGLVLVWVARVNTIGFVAMYGHRERCHANVSVSGGAPNICLRTGMKQQCSIRVGKHILCLPKPRGVIDDLYLPMFYS